LKTLQTVSKRFFVTLPDAIGAALDKWAVQESNKPATLAAFLLERVIRDAADQGKIPPLRAEGDATYKSLAQLVMRNWDVLTEYDRIPVDRLKAMRDDGDRPTELEVARLALALGLDEGYVESLAAKQK
jgi:hypothetical protein